MDGIGGLKSEFRRILSSFVENGGKGGKYGGLCGGACEIRLNFAKKSKNYLAILEEYSINASKR